MRVVPQTLAGLGHLWAGLASAAICYAEYLGLGAVLGPALLGYGDQSKSAGTLLIVLSALIASLLLGVRGIPMLAGPRGASLSILVLTLLWLQSHFAVTARQQLPLLASLMLGCTCMLWLAGSDRIQRGFRNLPSWLVPSFIYASAVGIVSGAVGKYLYQCLQIAPLQTWSIFLSATLTGILWPVACRACAKRLRPQFPRLASLATTLQGVALILAAGCAWLAYEFSALSPGQGGLCARLGRVDLDLHMLTERAQTMLQFLSSGITAPALLCAFVAGLFVGGVCTIETLTTTDSLKHSGAAFGLTIAPANSQLRLGAASNLLLCAATTVPASLSQSRTQLLWSLSPPSRVAVILHAAALAAIAILVSRWLAWLPQLALAVLMTLVATQMVSQSTLQIWKNAYDPKVAAALGLRAGLGLWLVLGITALTGQVLLAFVLPAMLFGVLRWLRIRRLQKKRKRLARSSL